MVLELDLIRQGLNVGPEDQSLWYYHQFLISNIVEHGTRASIVPHLTDKERIGYLEREIIEIKDLLEDYDDVKWIYEALIEHELAVAQIEDRGLSPIQINEVASWLEKIKALDPQRQGRWNDLKMKLEL